MTVDAPSDSSAAAKSAPIRASHYELTDQVQALDPPAVPEPAEDQRDEEDVEGCPCGMADLGAPGHEGHPDFQQDHDQTGPSDQQPPETVMETTMYNIAFPATTNSGLAGTDIAVTVHHENGEASQIVIDGRDDELTIHVERGDIRVAVTVDGLPIVAAAPRPDAPAAVPMPTARFHDLRKLLDYAVIGEERDFEEQDKDGQANHIYPVIERLTDWADGKLDNENEK